MRATTLFRRLLCVSNVVVKSVRLTDEGLILSALPTWRQPRCGACGQRAPKEDWAGVRRWRHLGLGKAKVYLECELRRVRCRRCGGVRVEKVPWAIHGSRFTESFEELVAYMAQSMDATRVTRLMGIAWASVGQIVRRVVARRQDPGLLEDLRRIGVDEFSYRRRHRYITTVVDHDRRRVVWAAKGHGKTTLAAFFEELGPERCNKIEAVTIDMAHGYIHAIDEHLPNADVVFDRYHVQKLANDALDEVRRMQLRDLRGSSAGRAIFRSRFALLKNPWNLSTREHDKLADIESNNATLFRAYLLKEGLAHALDYRQPARAERALVQWLGWASRSKLAPFIRAARTIRRHFGGIVAYVRDRLTNAIVEGMNNRLRAIAHRSFGFHGHQPLIAMLFLCCGGIQLTPPLPGPPGT